MVMKKSVVNALTIGSTALLLIGGVIGGQAIAQNIAQPVAPAAVVEQEPATPKPTVTPTPTVEPVAEVPAAPPVVEAPVVEPESDPVYEEPAPVEEETTYNPETGEVTGPGCPLPYVDLGWGCQVAP